MKDKWNELHPIADRMQEHVDDSAAAKRMQTGGKILKGILVVVAILVIVPLIMFAAAILMK
jgi:hypothetical protein